MGGLSFIGLILSINILTGKPREMTAIVLIVESVNVLFLLTSIVLFLTSAVTLASAYFESGVNTKEGLIRARRLNVSGTILTFWAVSALLLLAFDLTTQAIAYAIAAAVAPFAFLIARWKQGIPL